MSRAKDKILNKLIGQKIKEARLNRIVDVEYMEDNKIIKKPMKKLITQFTLGKALSVSFQQIQKYESGDNGLSSIKLLEICNFFNKPPEYFIGDATELLGKVRQPDNSSVSSHSESLNV